MSGTSHAPNEGSADTRQVTPAFDSSSCASSTAFVRKPTGNWSPTVLALRPRTTSRRRSVSPMSGVGGPRREKNLCPRSALPLFSLDLEIPRRRQFHAALPERLFRVFDVVLRRRDREDLRARLDSGRRADRGAERRAHALGDAVGPCARRDLVLPQHVVRVKPELEVVCVAGLLRDVPIGGNPRGLEGDVPDLTRLPCHEVDLHRKRRAEIADVELTDPDAGHAAHVLLPGVGLAADLAIHASGLPRHGGGAARRGERYLILRGLALISPELIPECDEIVQWLGGGRRAVALSAQCLSRQESVAA